MSTLSLLITYYNEIEYIESCLLSIKAQSVLPDEILIYDDASSKSPEQIIGKFPELNISYIKGDVNKGPGFARNYLLTKAKSEFVHFHDTDDLLKPNAIELIKGALNNDVDIVFNEIESRRNNVLVSSKVINYSELSNYDDLLSFAILKSILIPSITYRAKTAIEIGGFKDRSVLPQSEDYEFHLRLVSQPKKWTLINEAIVIQQLREESYSHQAANKKDVWTSAIKALMLNVDNMSSSHKQLVSERIFLCGAQLYNLNEVALAKNAFQQAKRFGNPTYIGRSKGYKIIASTLGEINAEKISKWIN